MPSERRAKRPFAIVVSQLTFAALCHAATLSTAAGVQSELRTISLDPDESYRVRDLRLHRGDVDLFLNEGVLTLARPIGGRRIAAVFSTLGSEAGDGEILVLPARPSERASLAKATGHANLDEHFTSAVFFFADRTLDDISGQLAARQLGRAPEIGARLAAQFNPVLQHSGNQVQTAILRRLLDNHSAANGPFYSTIMGRELGPFDFLFEPDSDEPVVLGHVERTEDGAHFRIWASYRPRRAPPLVEHKPSLSDYRLDVTLGDDLAMTASATFHYTAAPDDGRVIPLSLSPHLRVTSARVNGVVAEVIQPEGAETALESGAEFLLIAPQALSPHQLCRIEISYGGSVIRRVYGNSYFVADRTVWYPYATPMLTNFDLTFRFPDRFRLVATGELLSEQSAPDHTHIVHRRTPVPEQLAGFNLGQYTSVSTEAGPYHLDTYADASASLGMNAIPQSAAGILAYYTRLWKKLPIHSLSVTPIPGYFGQGFPGLIYLSTVAYMREEERPAGLRGVQGDLFFSRLLLPHEIAHQWWGNLVSGANYRSSWISEAMANYAALQFIGQQNGTVAVENILHHFRSDLLERRDGESVDAAGPVDFGARLLDNAGETVWHAIVYEKGAWALHMLEARLGPAAFLDMQKRLLDEYNGQAITNEQFRAVASRFVPRGQPDPSLKKFFETWIEGTGIPRLHLKHAAGETLVTVGGVDDEFTADVPLRCKTRGGRDTTRWLAVVAGDNIVRQPDSSTTCQLPRPSDFLYTQAEP